ncbi:Methyltransferase domain-containing protein [Yoonia tamlensis]|uniref:Methyltransferase domain-containing protein n=1 Tax=Yoonia tamlensis TaxID=390270 RepID=A0A1I6G9Z0_9RHOB|nr:class I SAM-dependent methyltransferase [Yoonia tamlensis]SFR38887.1 Methyltransferase domain-containing protein [Yoonia tamlensis]
MTPIAPHVSLDCCRSCAAAPLHVLHRFGATPIADRLVDPNDAGKDMRAPLTFVLCPDCGLAQIQETVEPRILFHEEYPYYSSVSNALSQYFRQSAETLIAKLDLDGSSRVMEAASNDGYLLRCFKEAGIPVLGIDPSDGPVDVARSKGIETIHGFFTAARAREIAADGPPADLFLANNVLAHVADPNDFVAGIAEVLSEDGIAVLEFAYLLDLVDNCAFDTIYHQHLLYLSLTAVQPIFERNGLYLNDAERTAVHGGSMRITVGRTQSRTPELERLLAVEKARNVGDPAFFAPLLARMAELKSAFRAMLDDYRARGVQLAGFGAAAKATTLLHHFDVKRSDIVYIADKSTWKQGLAMPGTRIPIVAPDEIDETRIGALVIFAWNFANEIMTENASFADNERAFIVPIPDLIVTRGAHMRAAL